MLANGRDALGGPYTPEIFRGLDRALRAPSVDDIDFAALRGKVVGVIGAGASAVDNAAEALEHGAARVAMMMRRPDMPRINKGMGIGSAGFWVGFNALTHAQKWQIVNYIDEQAVPAPRDSMLRVSRHKNFSLFASCSPLGVEIKDSRVLLNTTRGKLAFDFLILATGLTVDWSQRPELAALKPTSMLWGDHFTPDGHANYAQADHPYRRAFVRIPRTHTRHGALGRAHPRVQFPGLSEPRSDLRRYSGNQHRCGACRGGRRERLVRRGL